MFSEGIVMQILRGKVMSGTGNFAYWIEKLKDHYTRKTGLELFPGTLNLKLDTDFKRPDQFLRLEKEEYGGEVSVTIIPCQIFRRQAYILRTDKAAADPGERDIIEVATDVKLREAYGIKDGDEVEVIVE
jgi:riboflavin kinase, archaea type